jgi:hypothetical protein
MMRWADFWLRAAMTAQGLTICYWTAVSREAAAMLEEDAR